MHITIFIGGLSGGGAERVVCNLSNYLACKYHSVSIVTMSDNSPCEVLDKKIARVCLLEKKERKGFLINSCKRYKRLRDFVRNNNTDIYIAFLPVTICTLLSLRKIIKVPIVVSERNNPNSYSLAMKGLLYYFCGKADAFVFQTEEQKIWYSRIVNFINKGTVIIPNAVNVKSKPSQYNRDLTVVSAGRLSPQKNFELLINAFSIFHNSFPQYKLIIYGEGVLRGRLESLIETLGISDFVTLPGYSNSLNEELGKASMFVLSSNFEGIPNALIEAMQYGLPCVSTDCDGGGARLLIKNGVNGLIVEKENVSALANAMIKIGENKNLARRLGVAARESLDVFSPDIIYGKWESFIVRIINEHKQYYKILLSDKNWKR